MHRRCVFFLFVILMVAPGCQHTHLRNLTLRQASTLTDIHYQQVLDNLARIASNPHSLPTFAIPTAGQAQVDTSGMASFERDLLAPAKIFHLEGARATTGYWTLEPVNDTEKLMRMQCAYQMATGCEFYRQDCQSCDELFTEFYGDEKKACHLPRTGWFGMGCKRDIPDEACYWGRYCDTYVWVCPDGMAELTRLTGVILDFAHLSLKDPQQARLKWARDPAHPESKLVLVEIETVQEFTPGKDALPDNLRRPIQNGDVPDPNTQKSNFLDLPSGTPDPITTPFKYRGTYKEKGQAPGYNQRAIPAIR